MGKKFGQRKRKLDKGKEQFIGGKDTYTMDWKSKMIAAC